MSLGRRAERERIVRQADSVKQLSCFWPASCQGPVAAARHDSINGCNYTATSLSRGPVGRLQNLPLGTCRGALGRLRIPRTRVLLAARLRGPRPAGRRGGRRGWRRRRRLAARGRWIREVELVAGVEHLLQLRERQLGLVPPFVLDAQA